MGVDQGHDLVTLDCDDVRFAVQGLDLVGAEPGVEAVEGVRVHVPGSGRYAACYPARVTVPSGDDVVIDLAAGSGSGSVRPIVRAAPERRGERGDLQGTGQAQGQRDQSGASGPARGGHELRR